MSVKDGKDAIYLPPTLGTLIPHIHRAYYRTILVKHGINPQFEAPDPTEYYWVIELAKILNV